MKKSDKITFNMIRKQLPSFLQHKIRYRNGRN